MEVHPDFDILWCKDLLKSKIEVVEFRESEDNGGLARTGKLDERVFNSMFAQTLYTPTAIRAQLDFKRPATEPDAITSQEYCYLLSVGTGVDGLKGRAHGGFNALILDQMTGWVASQVSGTFAPATATMTVDYKAPIDTPGVVLCRGWPVESSGRKTWVKARLEDGTGRVLAQGKALFISPRQGGKL
ncbi:hypothetical protein LTR70_004235 [Exophiala xenobiotica]|uniref:Thioesterase domain-containing protein n=1 Tax=Lithohypha guttulata TaxID=1690604 RepID=A0ABR0KG29_9EURO|nr:hypothetical protein LTR24_003798 [Lithohypha guttulata]KAK5320990.1 hypothetical protein LTR70_004235 [Exophiala xenobiotica]